MENLSLGWQVQSRRPEKVIAEIVADAISQRRNVLIICLLEWAWSVLGKNQAHSKRLPGFNVTTL
jgi:hypothetical protein